MADEVITKTASEIEFENKQTETEKRIKQLSEKVRLTSEERDEKDKVLKERDAKIAELEQENSFSSSFSEILGTYGEAQSHREDIRAKVRSGYTVEDATLAVLAKAGKLGGNKMTASPQVAGGSAATTMASTGNKEVKDMTQAERRAQLQKDLIWQ